MAPRMDQKDFQAKSAGNSANLKSIKENIYNLIKSYEAFRLASLFPFMLTVQYPPSVTAPDFSAFRTLLTDLNTTPTFASSSSSKLYQKRVITSMSKLSNTGKVLATDYATLKSNVLTLAVQQFSTPLPAIGTSLSIDAGYMDNIRIVCQNLYIHVYSKINATLASGSTDVSALQSVFPALSTADSKKAVLSSLCSKLEQFTIWTYYFSYSDYADKLYQSLYNQGVTVNDTTITSPVERDLFFTIFQPYFMMMYLKNFVAEKSINSWNKAPLNFQVRRLAILAMYAINRYMLYGLYQTVITQEPSSSLSVTIRHLLDVQVTTVFANEDILDQEQFNLTSTLEEQTNINSSMSSQISLANRDIELTKNKVENIATLKYKLNSAYTVAQVYYWLWVALLIIFALFAFIVLFMKKYSLFYIGSGIIYIFMLISMVVYVSKKI